jgi:hypothetical protein
MFHELARRIPSGSLCYTEELNRGWIHHEKRREVGLLK